MTVRAAAALLLPLCLYQGTTAFVSPKALVSSPPLPVLTRRHLSSDSGDGDGRRGGSVSNMDGSAPERMSPEEDAAIQWDLFQKHHALGSWRGTWMTYNYIGDVVDSTVASVDLELDESGTSCTQIHKIVTGSVSADCETCFDSEDVQAMPVAQYSLGNLGRNRLASVGMVIGPSILRSGAMSTELILRHGDGRVRVIFQHAPVWEAGVEPGSCPPQGLKLYRTMVCREALRDGPPSAASEEAKAPTKGNPKFFRGVPPFHWHKKWAGTSWTWGPSTGDRGWSISEMEEGDAWHGRPMGDGMDVWSMRLPGGILMQCPRVIVSGQAGICRLAWLPEEDTDDAMLLRVEAGVLALEPILDDDDESMMVGFYPPSLGSLRCDVMKKQGELEDASQLKRLMEIDINSEGSVGGTEEGGVLPRDETEAPPPAQAVAPPSPPPSAPVAKGQSSSSSGQPAEKQSSDTKAAEKKSGGDQGEDSSKDNVRNILKF